jgi:putative oxidoreductase
MAFFTDKMGIPAVFAFLAVLAEFLGPIALFFGFLTRIAAFAIGFDMLVTAILVHVHFGFFMNWLGKQKGEGVEYDLLVWATALALILQGAGAFSLDRVISAKLKTNGAIGDYSHAYCTLLLLLSAKDFVPSVCRLR